VPAVIGFVGGMYDGLIDDPVELLVSNQVVVRLIEDRDAVLDDELVYG
jgi:hypothetical protein